MDHDADATLADVPIERRRLHGEPVVEGSGLSAEGTNSPLATLLIARATAAAVAFLVIEPSTTRAAFPEERATFRT